MMAMTLQGIFQSGIRVQRRLDRLARLDAVDVAFVDVNFDLQRIHVHDGADARAREAAAGGDRRNHLARLRVLGGDDAGERRADDRVVHLLLPHTPPGVRRR